MNGEAGAFLWGGDTGILADGRQLLPNLIREELPVICPERMSSAEIISDEPTRYESG
jgi:hypothetical protein